MSPETFQIVLLGLGGFGTVLVGVVGFLIRDKLSHIEKALEVLQEANKGTSVSVAVLMSMVTSLTSRVDRLEQLGR